MALPADQRLEQQQLTLRAVLAGLLVGTLLCFTNMYFGLQTGWVTMGSIQCAVVGFGLFQAAYARPPTTRTPVITYAPTHPRAQDR